MALSTVLLPSSSSSSSSKTTAATVTETSDRRRHHHHQSHTKRKKKPPPPPSLSPTPRTPPPPGSVSHRAMAAASSSKIKSGSSKQKKQVVAAAAGKKALKTTTPPASSWEQVKSLLSCRSATAASRVHDPAAARHGAGACGASLCAIRDVVDAASSSTTLDRDTTPLTGRSSRRRAGGHHQQPSSSLRGLSGCYECRAINVEPISRRYPRPRELCACSQCGEMFTKAESLEHHQAIRHAGSYCLVHNAARTVARFEAYRDAVRTAAARAAARAAADGNELLRFHSAPLACPLGLNGATSLCSSSDDDDPAAPCGVCAAIRHGFAPWVAAHPLGVRTTASSGRAHDCATATAKQSGCRAMLVCRVIAGRVRRSDGEEEGAFDSVAGDEAASTSVYGNLEELFVANPRAILPCFVVIYRVADHH
uniref:C2H2-type domain-containing protein n=1 Tax=Leersia perrieri TaxID=77586 RepID=A0A0D9W1U6_9ORYZ